MVIALFVQAKESLILSTLLKDLQLFHLHRQGNWGTLLHSNPADQWENSTYWAHLLFTHPVLPFFAFHLHQHQPKEAASKALTFSQAQEGSLPLTPSKTDDAYRMGKAHTSLFRAAELTGEWLWTESHKYMAPATLCQLFHQHISQYQEQEHPVVNIPHVTFLTEILCLLWSKRRELLPRTYTYRWRKKGKCWRRCWAAAAQKAKN